MKNVIILDGLITIILLLILMLAAFYAISDAEEIDDKDENKDNCLIVIIPSEIFTSNQKSNRKKHPDKKVNKGSRNL